ncbi:serine/arginine repetitive matrix protein 2 [Georgenia yuyongxinii]|uniref:Serine/arginine repetitive matrix protein 2 n=1 Tax=Georgenia yuyongxinii TaxID=2589797 RepID=A0A552WXC5_9MICO|nr:serine/arginine repetitive matrix protein 2 [Georgenia yuyongxinii]TRW47424.1 serine/arginine repetitive matrix protein 2 [Georgenia yuyongxinii]
MTPAPTNTQQYAFDTAEGLRALLLRLHRAGRGAWRHDDEAAQLMRHCMDRYRPLARKYRAEPLDAAAAAFEAMLAPATRWATDPWGVVTRAVKVTLMAEDRAHGLLCEVSRARHLMTSELHDAQRFAEHGMAVYHPALHTPAENVFPELDAELLELLGASSAAVELFVAAGWPRDLARTAIGHVCSRLAETGSRRRAHEYLRRDRQTAVLLDLDQRRWTALLSAVLGNPNPDLEWTAAGRGLLLRLAAGFPREELTADGRLMRALVDAAPSYLEASHV